jgi:hypothetical protein
MTQLRRQLGGFMMNKGWLVLILPLMIACSSEFKLNSRSQSSRPYVIKVATNEKYKLEAVFSGTVVEVGDRKVPVIEQLTVRSSETGQQIQYTRSDGPSSSDAHAYFTDVWSPDDELLVLPLDRFRGFCIVRAAEALAAIQKQSCLDTIRVRAVTGTAMWHQFEKWDTNQSFIFNAGLSGDQTRLKYDISHEQLTALELNFSFLEGENSKGNIKITRGP